MESISDKEELKQKLADLEKKEVEIKKQWKDTYNKIKEIEKEEKSWKTCKFEKVTK